MLAVAALAYGIFIARTAFRIDGALHFSLFDDAMISMRYARNLADGSGLVWNPGEAPVEGYTNLLWTLWMAALHLILPVSDATASLAVMLSSAALLLLNLVVVRAVADRLGDGSRLVTAVAVVLTASYYPLVFWSLRGMEVGLLALLISTSLLLALRLQERYTPTDLARLALVVGAALLTRTDAVIPAVIVAAFVVTTVNRSSRVQTLVTLAATIAGTLVALTLFRLAYYGDALPNTYYLKLTGVGLDVRVAAGLLAFRQLVLVHLFAPVIAAGIAVATRWRQHTTLLLAGIVTGQAAYSVWTGGDAWEALHASNRYLATVAPVLFLLAAVGIREVASGTRRRSLRMLGWTSVATGGALLLLREYGEQTSRPVAGIDNLSRYGPLLGVVTVVCLWVGTTILLAMLRLRGRATSPPVSARSQALVAIVACTMLIVVMNYRATTSWYRHNAPDSEQDAKWAELGVRERAVTDGQTSIASSGNSSYFHNRYAVDLLGKSDRRIARLPVPEGATFRSGHNKLDLAYSVGELRPDIVEFSSFVPAAPEIVAAFHDWGYDEVAPGIFVRRDTSHVSDPEQIVPRSPRS